MRVAITGASGFVGQALGRALARRGDEVVAARRGGDDTSLRWSVDDGFTPANALSGFDAVVHLAAEGLADGRWTQARKHRIERSRVEGTRRVVEALEVADPRPATFICASAVGYYGDTKDRVIDEGDGPGEGFLAEVARAWEDAAKTAEAIDGVRVVRARLAVVLGPGGGALAKMLPAFKMGVGGRLGDGHQYMSWIHIDDAVAALLHILDTTTLTGAVNVCSPQPVTNREFTEAMGAALHRPTVLPLPAFALKVLFGELGEATLLAGQRVLPARLRETAFTFAHPTIEGALRAIFH